MGLFDKKQCAICGEKIGLFGNRKLEDGNLCKECAKDLSPLFTERRQSTVDEISAQLEYRKQNQLDVDKFSPTRTLGRDNEIKIDESNQTFIYCKRDNYKEHNPDVIKLSQVLNCMGEIKEEKEEIYRKDSEGNRESYNPRRYKTLYEFYVVITIDSPWFDEIELRIDNPFEKIDSRRDIQFEQCEEISNQICEVMLAKNQVSQQPQFENQPQQNAQPQQAQTSLPKFCGSCGAETAPNAEGNCPYCDAKFGGGL